VVQFCARSCVRQHHGLDPGPEPLRSPSRTASHRRPPGRRLLNLPNPFPHKETPRPTSIMTKYY
jgi:hypothetical protein